MTELTELSELTGTSGTSGTSGDRGVTEAGTTLIVEESADDGQGSHAGHGAEVDRW